MLKDDPAYAQKAQRVSALAKDIVEILREEPIEKLELKEHQRLAFHCPAHYSTPKSSMVRLKACLASWGFANAGKRCAPLLWLSGHLLGYPTSACHATARQ